MVVLASFLGLDDEKYKPVLETHQNRFIKYSMLVAFYYGLTYIVFMLLGLAILLKSPITNLPTTIGLRIITSWWGTGAVVLVSLLFILLLVSLGLKVASALVDKNYADTLAVFHGLNLLIELQEDDELNFPHARKRLQYRIQALCRAIILLGGQYGTIDSGNEQKVYEHFKGMERFIREREGWLAMPKKDSLEIFCQDLLKLVQIFISGNYGEFQPTVIDEPMEAPKPFVQRIWDSLLKFIGIGIPVGVLVLVYVDPTVFEARSVDSNTVVLIAIAWLLLTLDAYLKLGVVERITGLAKTIRDLG